MDEVRIETGQTEELVDVTDRRATDPAVARDMVKSLSGIVGDAGFEHAEGTRAAHVTPSLIGCTAFVPVEDGERRLGIWQSIFFAEFDGPRKRTLWARIPPIEHYLTRLPPVFNVAKSLLPLIAQGIIAFLAVSYLSYTYLGQTILASLGLGIACGIGAALLGLEGGATGSGGRRPRHEHEEDDDADIYGRPLDANGNPIDEHHPYFQDDEHQ